MAKDLLLEIGTEEIPARFMAGALAQLESITRQKFADLRIACSQVQAMGTPRRLTLVIKNVHEQQADSKSENKGPSIKIAFDEQGNATKAAQGFARGQGVDVSALQVKDGYVYAVVEEIGQPVESLLPNILPEIMQNLSFPKNMRWADLDVRFVRPIKWIIALFGEQVISFQFAGVSSGSITRGHRFLSTGDIKVNSLEEYFAALEANFVVLDQEKRRELIREQIGQIAITQGGVAEIDSDLLEEVVHLVEYPTVLCGSFESDYLKLPPEAIITPMREHQRYFPVFSPEGKLLPVFITVRNGGAEHLDIIRHGNERVLKARLADARFFFEEDQKVALIDRRDKLKTIVYQDGLGTLFDKTIRIEELAIFISRLFNVDMSFLPSISRAAKLAKTDLVTGMVYEFTELQGTMGREYARLNGETEEVAQAIFEHYLPRFSGDVLPQHIVGRVISIADKIDNIVATFSRGLIPTGSQDPYALRRQALGIVNILIDAQYSISLAVILEKSMDLLGIVDKILREKLLTDIQDFFRLRLKNILSDKNVRYDLIDAAVDVGIDDLYDTYLRATALLAIIGDSSIEKSIQAFVRSGNLAKHATQALVLPELFVVEAEQDLYQTYLLTKQSVEMLIAVQDYPKAIIALCELAEPIDRFFNAVMVMDKDEAVRNNRLALLKQLIQLTGRIADWNKIVS